MKIIILQKDQIIFNEKFTKSNKFLKLVENIPLASKL